MTSGALMLSRNVFLFIILLHLDQHKALAHAETLKCLTACDFPVLLQRGDNAKSELAVISRSGVAFSVIAGGV